MNRLQQKRIRTVGYCRQNHITNNVDEQRGDGIIDNIKNCCGISGRERISPVNENSSFEEITNYLANRVMQGRILPEDNILEGRLRQEVRRRIRNTIERKSDEDIKSGYNESTEHMYQLADHPRPNDIDWHSEQLLVRMVNFEIYNYLKYERGIDMFEEDMVVEEFEDDRDSLLSSDNSAIGPDDSAIGPDGRPISPSSIAEGPRGEGVISWIKGIRDKSTKKFLEDRPKVLTKLIEKDGGQIITKIEVCRVPITGVFSKALNILTLGRLKREMKKKGYDNLYHLYMILYLANGKVYSLEKNQRINVIEGKKAGPADACAPALIYGKESLGQFLMNAESKKISGFYRYNAFKDNCQKWIYDIMNSNSIGKFNNFILQDVSTLAPSYLSRIVRGVTDVAGVVDYAVRGGKYKK